MPALVIAVTLSACGGPAALMSPPPNNPVVAPLYGNLLENFLGTDSYSFVLAGESGALDHAFASQSLVGRVTGVMDWHINADEPPVQDYNLELGRDPGIFDGASPYRASDHDPVSIGLNPTN